MSGPRLSLRALPGLPTDVRRPVYDPARIGVGIVHIGIGAFHRAHQAVFTDDAIASAGGNWGIRGVSLQRPDAARALNPQDGLYAVETLGGEGAAFRVVGSVRDVVAAPAQPNAVLAAIADPAVSVLSLTITEKGYTLGADGRLDLEHPDIVHDLGASGMPRSALGWLVAGLDRRRVAHGAPITLLSCDNLSDNGAKLGAALAELATRIRPTLLPWLEAHTASPNTMVDCIVPASDAASLQRARQALGMEDAAAVQREPFAQWVIEDRFAGPRPQWEAGGAEFVADVAAHERLKLRVLNAAHSAMAYHGLARGHEHVRDAAADEMLMARVDAMIAEVAMAYPELPVAAYWERTRLRFGNPAIAHRLAQIAQDGSVKLPQRILPSLVANARASRPTAQLAGVVLAWLRHARQGPVADPAEPALAAWRQSGGRVVDALDSTVLFPASFREDEVVRAAILDTVFEF